MKLSLTPLVVPTSSANRRPAVRKTLPFAAFLTATAMLPMGALTGAAPAAPNAKSQRSGTLAFNVTARLSSIDGDNSQTFSSRIQSKGNRVRVETRLGDRPVVFLTAPPYFYKLIPTAKAGVRWENRHWTRSRFDIQSLLRDPAAIRTLLRKRGAKQIGKATIDGVATEIFTAQNVLGEGSTVKAWLRTRDALPVRMEGKARGMKSLMTWTNYRRDIPLADSLFRVPADYSIREAQGSPGLF